MVVRHLQKLGECLVQRRATIRAMLPPREHPVVTPKRLPGCAHAPAWDSCYWVWSRVPVQRVPCAARMKDKTQTITGTQYLITEAHSSLGHYSHGRVVAYGIVDIVSPPPENHPYSIYLWRFHGTQVATH